MLKGYKTIAFNVIMSLVTVIALFNQGAELPDAETVRGGLDAVDTAIAAVWGIGNIILRAVTDTPVFKKEPKDAA